MLEIKTIVTKMRNAFFGLINRLDMDSEERIHDLKDRSMKTSQTKIYKVKKKNPRTGGQCQKIYTLLEYQKEMRKQTRKKYLKQ